MKEFLSSNKLDSIEPLRLGSEEHVRQILLEIRVRCWFSKSRGSRRLPLDFLLEEGTFCLGSVSQGILSCEH